MPSSSGRTLVYDAETNGLRNVVNALTKMWCVVAQDYDTGEKFLFHDFPQFDNYKGFDDLGEPFTLPPRDGTLREGVKFINSAKSIICHNQLGFDQRVMKDFFPFFKLRHNWPEVRDTLLESQVQWFDRPAVKGFKGIHGLDPWGARIGVRKPPITDWTVITGEILHRCLEDVDINYKVAKRLEKERETIFEKCGVSFDEALVIEHTYRHYCTLQEDNGALVDKKHMQACVKELDTLTQERRDKIEPQLPPTIIWGTKTTTHDVATRLGAKKIPPIRTEYRLHGGEMKEFEIKDWYTPTIKWLNVTKKKRYYISDGENLVHDEPFGKLKEAREYAKENILVHNPKIKLKYPSEEYKLEAYNNHTRDHFGDDYLEHAEIIGPFTKFKWEDSVMSQHEKVKLLLVSLGWDTDEWTLKTDSDDNFVRAESPGEVYWPKVPINGKQLVCHYKKGEAIPVTPKVTKDSYATLPPGLGDTIKEYNAYTHRRGFIENPEDDTKGLLNNIRSDGRITCGIMSFGTTAGRASHQGWVNAPGLKALYGKQIREIIIASPGHQLIGVDMPSAHPRLLADFTGNQTFIDAVDGREDCPETGKYIGEDFHTVNSVLFKLNTQEDVERARLTQDEDLIHHLSLGRGTGKGGSYATLYGGSGKKVALTIGVPVSEGEKLKISFLSGLGLDILLEEVMQDWNSRKWGYGSIMTVLGGYQVHCTSKHKIINYKALGSEAVVQKVALIWVSQEIERLGLKAKVICSVHDEILFEVPDDEIEQMKKVASGMYPAAANQLGLTLDWTSTAKVGQSYAKVH